MTILILRSSSAASQQTWLSNLGLLWTSGVEPSGNENIMFPFQSGGGRRIWYVDANASSNGDGSSGSPYWGLTEVTANLGSGDHVWVTGDFTAAKHNAGVRDMHLTVTSAAKMGTTTNPTVVRSWPGRSRAKFDGNYTTKCGIFFDPSTNDGTRGIVALNIEVTRCDSAGPIVLGISNGIAYQRVVSCYIHHNYSLSGGPNSNYGGAYMAARGTACDIQAYNNLTHDNNTSDGSTVSVDNNTGGLSLLSDPGSAGSVVKFFNNLQYNEHRAIRHKHDNDVSFEAYYNYAYNCTNHFYIRVSTLNTIHHNIFRDGAQAYSSFILVENENQIALRTINAYNNTVVRVQYFTADGDTAYTFNDVFNAHENIHCNPSSSAECAFLGNFSSYNYPTATASFDNNVIQTGGTSTFWKNNGTTKTRAQFDSQFGTDNVYSDPLFNNLAGNDFTLQSGSPARNINSTGLQAGAFGL